MPKFYRQLIKNTGQWYILYGATELSLSIYAHVHVCISIVRLSIDTSIQ